MIYRFLIGCLFLASISPAGGQEPDVPSNVKNAVKAFETLAADLWEFDKREDSLWSMYTGDHRFNDRLPRMDLANIARRHEYSSGAMNKLAAIDRNLLPPKIRTDYDIFRMMLSDRLEEFEHEAHLTPITNRWGFHIDFAQLPDEAPLKTERDYENYIARLEQFERYAEDHIGLLAVGIEKGKVLPSIVLDGYEASIEAQIPGDDISDNRFFGPLKNLPDHFDEATAERLRSRAEKAIRGSVAAGYSRFLEFMKKEYVPSTRGSVGVSAIPGGRAYYRFCVRKFTTLDLTPEEVHGTGLREVERLRKEMEQVIREVKFEGDFAAFVKHLRTDPKFYPQSKEELLRKTAFVLKRMDGELPRLFNTLPRTPYGIKEVPAYIAPKTTSAYYQPPPGDRTRAGFYFVNAYNLASRPLYGVEALSLHEAVPGHHLQLALQNELDEMPPFRRFSNFTVFIEGWALYSERLGLEVGMYEDPYSNFGRLSYEMWRACRLVVDTGIHYLGWTRQEAIDFMAKNTALSMHNIEAEVDRYISWPGQALAYKTGEMRITALRQEAEQRLGGRFDVRLFHDAVLLSGSVPIPVLEENVKRYIRLTEKKDRAE